MGQLRTTTAALARTGCPPGQIMRQLSGLVAAHGEEVGATCLYAVYGLTTRGMMRGGSERRPVPAV